MVVLEFYCLVFPNILGCWRPEFTFFLDSFHSRVEFGTILDGLRNFAGGVLNPPPKPTHPPRYATDKQEGEEYESKFDGALLVCAKSHSRAAVTT